MDISISKKVDRDYSSKLSQATCTLAVLQSAVMRPLNMFPL